MAGDVKSNDMEKALEEKEGEITMLETGESQKKISLRKYTRKVLSVSLVTGVTNIVETSCTWRKYFKLVVLLLCTAGFFYQAAEFVMFALSYPSVVDIQVYMPKEYNSPAYTICNSNGIKRSKFCKKYPEYCEHPKDTDEFCRLHPRFCKCFGNVSDITVPSRQYYYYEKFISFEELKEVGHDVRTLIRETDSTPPSNEMSGPYFVQKKEDGTCILCYTLYLRVNSTLEPHTVEAPDRIFRTLQEFTLDVEPCEVFLPFRRPGAYFSVHSPFALEDPLENGIFIKPEHSYMVQLRMQEEDLLPSPYESDYINYTEVWIRNGRKGTRSQEACVQFCLYQEFMRRCNCSVPQVLYPHEGPYCSLSDALRLCLEDITQRKPSEESEVCFAGCKNDCKRVKYLYAFQMRLLENDPYDEIKDHNISVTVLQADPEVIRYQYRPQYQTVEVFSNLGGFIGVWMGVSLVAVIDLFESGARILAFMYRRRRQRLANGNPRVKFASV